VDLFDNQDIAGIGIAEQPEQLRLCQLGPDSFSTRSGNLYAAIGGECFDPRGGVVSAGNTQIAPAKRDRRRTARIPVGWSSAPQPSEAAPLHIGRHGSIPVSAR